MIARDELRALSDAFEEARPRIDAALEHSLGEYTTDDLKDMVMRGRATLWHTEGYSGVTKVVDFPRKRWVAVIAAGGSLEALRSLAKPGGAFEQYAQAVGADGIIIEGRKGWGRAFAPYGYKASTAQIVKEL